MENKTIIKLLTVFSILLLISLYPSIKNKLYGTGGVGERLYDKDIGIDGLNKIVIGTNSVEKIIEKSEESWKINGNDASPKEIEKLINSLKETKKEELVSKNPENHINYEVTEDKGAVLSLFSDGQEIFSIILGKQGPASKTFYLRMTDEENVFLSSGELKDIALNSEENWRDKIVADISEKEIENIELTGKNSLLISKNNGTWKMEGSGKTLELKEEKILPIISLLKPLEADGFLNEKEVKEFESAKDKKIMKINFAVEDKPLVITATKKENEYWAKREDKKYFYRISLFKLNGVFDIDPPKMAE